MLSVEEVKFVKNVFGKVIEAKYIREGFYAGMFPSNMGLISGKIERGEQLSSNLKVTFVRVMSYWLDKGCSSDKKFIEGIMTKVLAPKGDNN